MVSRAYTLGEFVERFGGELIGDPMVRIEQVASLTGAGPRDISFCHRGDYAALLSQCRAGALILTEAARNATTTPRIVTGDPYLYFARVSGLLNPPRKPRPGIDPTASVAGDARIHPAASVGPQCDIGSGAQIDADAVLAAGSKIGERVTIGAGTVVNSNAVVYADCVVGKRCIVHSGAVIGADGFGFAPDQGAWLKIPQIGRVVIGDDVEVGANTSIDRGALDDTVIEDGVKLDNQVQIGHNCRIGAHTAIAGCVGIAGSTRIGAQCMIGGAAMIAGHLEIADKTIISAGTLIAASITIADTYAGVYPADTSRRWRKNAALLRNLDRMANRIKALEARLERLSPTSAHDDEA